MSRTLINPFFLDRPATDLLRFAPPDAWVNQPALPDAELPVRLGLISLGIADVVAATVTSGQRPVLIGGDCCAAIGVIAGLQRGGVAPRLLWLDAHGDFNTPETSPSGFIGGMPLAMLVGRGDQTLMRRAGATPLPEDDVLLFDARNLDAGERLALDTSRVTRLSTIEAVASAATGDRPIYVHLDVDVLNPLDAPAMLYATSGGPRLGELETLARTIAARRPVAISVTAWAFDRDSDRSTERACLRVLDALRGA